VRNWDGGIFKRTFSTVQNLVYFSHIKYYYKKFTAKGRQAQGLSLNSKYAPVHLFGKVTCEAVPPMTVSMEWGKYPESVKRWWNMSGS